MAAFPTKDHDPHECPACGAGYVADSGRKPIRDKDDARCSQCRCVMISWPAIGLRLVSPSKRKVGPA